MLTLRPLLYALRQKLGGLAQGLEDAAVESWEVAPASERYIRPAISLPGQLDRIRGTEFGPIEQVIHDLKGDFVSIEEPTIAYKLRSVDLIDGVLYAQGLVAHLRTRDQRVPIYRTPPEVENGSLYECWSGNRWFGNWLQDNCLTYWLAEEHGTPVTTLMNPSGHIPRYEELLGMTPNRVNHIHFNELTLFRDVSHNSSRRARADKYRRKLVATAPIEDHPGVFLLRGKTGMQRVLTNEQALAEELGVRRGFTVIDPSSATVDEIVSACAGARVIVGVEGSQLVHGLMVMHPDAALLVIQPPERTVCVLKFVTDRQEQDFAFVVATGSDTEFHLPWEELERTLDLVLEEKSGPN